MAKTAKKLKTLAVKTAAAGPKVKRIPKAKEFCEPTKARGNKIREEGLTTDRPMTKSRSAGAGSPPWNMRVRQRRRRQPKGFWEKACQRFWRNAFKDFTRRPLRR